jgi:hypothetical protein
MAEQTMFWDSHDENSESDIFGSPTNASPPKTGANIKGFSQLTFLVESPKKKTPPPVSVTPKPKGIVKRRSDRDRLRMTRNQLWDRWYTEKESYEKDNERCNATLTSLKDMEIELRSKQRNLVDAHNASQKAMLDIADTLSLLFGDIGRHKRRLEKHIAKNESLIETSRVERRLYNCREEPKEDETDDLPEEPIRPVGDVVRCGNCTNDPTKRQPRDVNGFVAMACGHVLHYTCMLYLLIDKAGNTKACPKCKISIDPNKTIHLKL